MIGMVLIGHAHIASEMKSAVEHVLGEQPLMATMDVSASDDLHALQQQLSTLVMQCNAGDGTLVFADMSGGTPCNIALGCLKDDSCEVISGFNLPLLIKAASDRADDKQKGKVDLTVFAQNIVASGRQYMSVQTDLLPIQKQTQDEAGCMHHA